MDNVIPLRIAGFLKQFPPFSLLSIEELGAIASRSVVRYIQKEEPVFAQGESPGQYFFIVHDGVVRLEKEEGGIQSLIDVCDDGDIFGFRAIIAADNYKYTARANEETLLYAIHHDSIIPFFGKNREFTTFLLKTFAIGYTPSAAGNNQFSMLEDQVIRLQGVESMLNIRHIKSPTTCKETLSIREAAILMQENKIGSIVVIGDKRHPIGIITNRDFRNKVVAGQVDPTGEVKTIMSSPVITIDKEKSIFEVQMKMMEFNIRHLCVTKTGEPNSPLIGVISEHDLNVFHGRNPAIFIKEIHKCGSTRELKGLRASAESLLSNFMGLEVSIEFISRMVTRINDAVVNKAVELTLNHLDNKGIDRPQLKWCWMSLGSAGRKEQLIRTDQDHAIVFQDVRQEGLEEVRAYFLKLAKGVSGILNECGFEYCPSDMMASNPRWCLSIAEWKEQFHHWIHHPTEKNIMYCTIFFDFRSVYGDEKLTHTLSQHIYEEIDPESMFAVNMGKNAVQNPPPLTFFRNILVERNGEHKDEFDLKARAMMPLVDAARLLMLTSKVPFVTNTIERYKSLAAIDNNNAELFLQAAEAFEALLSYKATHGLKNDDNGRYIDPRDLSKMEKLALRNCFRPIEELHKLLIVRFRLSQFM